jgi:predicted nucleic acid-binding protein
MTTPSSIFLDTGYVIALELSDDQHHDTAVRYWRELSSLAPRIVTTTYVFDEIVTFFNNRDLHDKAVEIGARLLGSPSVRFVHVDEGLFLSAWEYFRQHSDKRYSLTDCVSFVVMNQMGIQSALAFDRHFIQAGFERLP